MSDDFPDPRLAERLTRAARAAQALSETLWETLHEELSDPRAERVAELSEQLGEVAAIVTSLAHVDARARQAPADARAGEAPVGRRESEPRGPRTTDDGPSTRERSMGEPSPLRPLPPSPSQESSPPSSPFPSREPSPSQESSSPRVSYPPRESAATTEPLSRAVLVDELAPEGSPQIEIRDVRGEEDGPAAWIGSIGRRLERYEHDGSPFAVLLVEIVDIERLRQAEPVDELSRLTNQVEDALARGLRPADSLTCEIPGRYWLLAPQTDVTGAQLLAERIARAVRTTAGHRGTPLEVAVGIAVCPDDGRQASELAAHADVGLYAARAAGRSSIR